MNIKPSLVNNNDNVTNSLQLRVRAYEEGNIRMMVTTLAVSGRNNSDYHSLTFSVDETAYRIHTLHGRFFLLDNTDIICPKKPLHSDLDSARVHADTSGHNPTSLKSASAHSRVSSNLCRSFLTLSLQ